MKNKKLNFVKVSKGLKTIELVPYLKPREIKKPPVPKIKIKKAKRSDTYVTGSGKVVKNRPNRNKRFAWIL